MAGNAFPLLMLWPGVLYPGLHGARDDTAFAVRRDISRPGTQFIECNHVRLNAGASRG